MIPNIYWGQTSEHIFVKFDLSNVTGLNIDFSNNKLVMSGYSKSRKYETNFTFYKEIETDNSVHKYTINELNIECKIKKKVVENWNYLIQNQSFYKNHIKIDWSKWIVSNDDSLFDSQLQTIMNNVYNKSTIKEESLNKKTKIKTTNLNGLDCCSDDISYTSDD
mgnify:CR=1 FL=1